MPIPELQIGNRPAMTSPTKKTFISDPIEIAEGIFWVGFYDEVYGLQCNPYLVVDGDEAVLIDGGSRPDFSTVMMKILQTGVDTSRISRLIYQHYDPDLCGSIPNLEDIIKNPDLRILSHRENNHFIKYYATSSPLDCIEDQHLEHRFAAGRVLQFIRTPYSHSAGSFMTYDPRTRTLLTSDLFGSFGRSGGLFFEMPENCSVCDSPRNCHMSKPACNVEGVLNFHRKIMTSNRALRFAMARIECLEVDLIAPQHGSLLTNKAYIAMLTRALKELDDVGIDGIVKGE